MFETIIYRKQLLLFSGHYARQMQPSYTKLLYLGTCILQFYKEMESMAAWDATHAKQKIAKMIVSMYASTFDFLEKQFCSIFGMSFCCLFFLSPCLLLPLSLPSEGCLLAPIIAVALKLIGFQRLDDNSICRFYFLVWFRCSAEMDENLISEDENSIFD